METRVNKGWHNSGAKVASMDFHGLDPEACLKVAKNLATDIGRKFEIIDVQGDNELDAAAMAYTLGYTGTFEFMVEMKAALTRRGFLSDGQVKGVLNVMRADMVRQAEAKPEVLPGKVDAVIRDGIYTVTLDDGSYVTLRVQHPDRRWDSLEEGTQVLSYLNGPSNETAYQRFAFLKGSRVNVWSRYKGSERLIEGAAKLVSGDLDAFGKAYAQESGRCYICNRLLTTPDSIAKGIGPICESGGF